MELTDNKFHNRHLYLQIDEKEVPFLEKSVFEALIREYGRPLQVMLSSDNKRLIAILEEAGFVLKRKCFEMEVGPADLIDPLPDCPPALSEARKGTPAYAACAEMLFKYYSDTHAAVSPLTASMEEFADTLPETVLYSATEDGMTAAAFIEDNEIAYLVSKDADGFRRFAEKLLATLFSRYDRIVFEADDTDRTAIELKELFTAAPEPSWDTYIKTP